MVKFSAPGAGFFNRLAEAATTGDTSARVEKRGIWIV